MRIVSISLCVAFGGSFLISGWVAIVVVNMLVGFFHPLVFLGNRSQFYEIYFLDLHNMHRMLQGILGLKMHFIYGR